METDGTHLGLLVEFCFSSCRNLANGDTGLGAGLVILSITADSTPTYSTSYTLLQDYSY